MYDTYKFMKSFQDPKLACMTYEELSELYKVSPEQAIVAEVFIRAKQYINRCIITHKLPPEDVCSFALLIIHKSLTQYTPGKNKYFTYLCTALENKCVYLKKKKFNSKNRIQQNTISYVTKDKDVGVEAFDLENLEELIIFDQYANSDFLLTYQSLNLTYEEKVFINGIILGKSKKEIAEDLSVSCSVVNCIKNNLTAKIYAAGVV